jgi:hypothetical protein
MATVSEVLEAEGHLIDSAILNVIFDTVVRLDGEFEVLKFDIGRTNDDSSRLEIRVKANDRPALTSIVTALIPLGCRVARAGDATTQPVAQVRCAPETFYSTTNHRTQVRLAGARDAATERDPRNAIASASPS